MRDEIPKLTRGGLLVDRLVQATMKHCENTSDRGLLEAMAESRLRIQAYITAIEKQAGTYDDVASNAGGRPKSKGWGVCKTRHGTWRLTLTSLSDGRPRQVGTFNSRLEADTRGRELVAELRGEAA